MIPIDFAQNINPTFAYTNYGGYYYNINSHYPNYYLANHQINPLPELQFFFPYQQQNTANTFPQAPPEPAFNPLQFEREYRQPYVRNRRIKNPLK